MRSAKLILTVVILLASAQFVSAETMTLTATDDVFLNRSLPDNNYGAGPYIACYHADTVNGAYYTSLLSFDLSDAQLAGATIDSATLTLTCSSAIPTSKYLAVDVTVGIYELLDDFVEGTKNGAAATTGEPSWNYRVYNTAAWDTVGALGADADYDSTMLASFTHDQIAMYAGLVCDFTSTGDFASAVEGNIGGKVDLLAKFNTNYKQMMQFHSKDNTVDSAYSPKLTIEYTPVPEPGTFALLATGLIGLLAYAWRKRK